MTLCYFTLETYPTAEAAVARCCALGRTPAMPQARPIAYPGGYLVGWAAYDYETRAPAAPESGTPS